MTRKELKEIWGLMTPEQRIISIEYHALGAYLKKRPKKKGSLPVLEAEMDKLARQYAAVTLDDDKPPPPPPPPPPWW